MTLPFAVRSISKRPPPRSAACCTTESPQARANFPSGSIALPRLIVAVISSGKARALALLGRPEEARKLLEHTLKQTSQLHLPLEQSQALIVLGQVAATLGDPKAATQYFEEAGRLSRASGFIHSIAWSMYEAAKVYREEGRYADAERCETQAMDAMRQVSDEYHLPLHLAMLPDL
jgi:tetratricopeptide (TPR) repeat protein